MMLEARTLKLKPRRLKRRLKPHELKQVSKRHKMPQDAPS